MGHHVAKYMKCERDDESSMATERQAERFGAQAIQKLSEIEELAEEILSDKQKIVDLDRQRNGNREAIGALKRKKLNASKSWVCFGNMFMKLPDSAVQTMLGQDQKTLEEEIGILRKNLKAKVEKLHELEGLPDVKGFDLNALTDEDLTVLK